MRFPIFIQFLLVLICLSLSAISTWAAEPETGAVLNYRLPTPSYVTLVIETPRGSRVRNLLACVWREAGAHSEVWDGLDDAGQPAPPGEYRWRGLTHGPITATFQTAFYSPGNPPWLTVNPVKWNLRAGTAGGWLSDHMPPSCLFADERYVYIGAEFAEAGHALIEVTPEGQKRWGALWFSCSGSAAVATADGIIYVAGEKGWMGDVLAVHRVDQQTHQFRPNPASLRGKRPDAAFVRESSQTFSGIRGMAICGPFIVLSLADKGRLALFDRETAAFVREVPLPGAGALARAANGDLFAVSECRVVRVDLLNGHHQPVVSEKLQAPGGLAMDANSELYVTDLAPEEQCVKVFSADGRFLRRIGRPGGRREGAFDPLAMAHPAAVALDAKGQLWVAERDFLPKRVSVWSKQGMLLNDFLGPVHYGGGGSLDLRDARRAYYNGMTFTLGERPRQTRLDAVLFRPEEHADLPLIMGPDYPLDKVIVRQGKCYLVSDYGPGVSSILISEVVGNHAVPRIILGPVALLKKAWAKSHPEFVAQLGVGPTSDKGLFLWQDRQGDGKARPEDITLRRTLALGLSWSCLVGQQLELHALAKNALLSIPPRPGAALSYDFADAAATPLPPKLQGRQFVALATDRQGNYLLNQAGAQGDPANNFLSLSPGGEVRWTYPNPYPGNNHNSPRPEVGDIRHTLNVEGFARANNLAGDVFQLNGNKGVRYLFTTDGLFVAQVYGDMRYYPLQQTLQSCYNADGTGVRLEDVSLCDECFFGWLGQAPDGRVLQIEGKDAGNVIELHGLPTLAPLAGGMLHLAHAAATPGSAEAVALPIEAIQIAWGGQWNILPHFPIPPGKPRASAVLGYTPNEVQLHVEVRDAKFQNAGEDITALFKTGDAVDFRFATDPNLPEKRTAPGAGDLRIIIAPFHGKPVAICYRFTALGAANPVNFTSPTGTTTVAEVTQLKNVGIEVTTTPTGYMLTAAIPWKMLGLTGPPVGIRRGDIGVLFADPSGARTVARCYHFDQESQVVVDLPSEANVVPARWGKIRF